MKKLTITLLLCMALNLSFSQTISLNLKVFIEGPYFNNEMTPFLNVLGHLPTSQPYNTPPWNYNGSETVITIPSVNIVDWVLVDVLKPHNDGNQIRFEIMGRKAGFLFKDGFIKDIDGLSNLAIETTITSGFYIRVHHRNHLSVISSVPLIESGGVFTYDFTFPADQAMGGSLSQKQLSPVIWGMIAADGNASGQIDNRDKNEVWLLQQNLTGYYEGDFNMDAQVDSDDKIVKWKQNAGTSTYPVKDTVVAPVTWICGDTIIDTRDGQIYNTVLIGDQCWMAENLNIGTIIPGEIYMTNNDTIEKYCFENDTANCDTYGGLYEWYEIMEYTDTPGVQGICPPGWHLPTDLEWTLLTDFLGGTSIAGGKMKEAGFTHWSPPNTDATNESAFTGLPGGTENFNNEFSGIDSTGRWWSSTKYYWDKKMNLYNLYKGFLSYSFGLSYDNGNISRSSYPHDWGLSVRCLSDNPGSGLPKVTTSYIYNISDSSATGGGIVAAQGDLTVIERGICWSTSQYPTINDPHTIDGEGIGPFTSEINGLNNNTIYYVRAYATNNSEFTAYGNMVSFYTQFNGGGGEPCPNVPTVTYEGHVYNTVQIGNQCWLRENLNVGEMMSGSFIQTDNGQIEKHCYYDEPGFCDIYGGLYQWNETMNYNPTEGSQGICPPGWHIPTIPEWNSLFDYLGGNSVAGGKMKEAGLAHWLPPNTAATNESGFTSLPGGYFESFYYYGIGNYGRWWTSNSINNLVGHGIKMTYNNPGISSFTSLAIRESNSVRCIKDLNENVE